MSVETSAQLVATTCDALALLIPFLLVWNREKRGVLFGTISTGFFISMPT